MAKQTVTQGDVDRAVEGTSGNRVFYSMAKTINIGDYESIRVEFGLSKVVPDGGSFDEVKKAVKAEVVAEWSEMTDKTEEIFKKK